MSKILSVMAFTVLIVLSIGLVSAEGNRTVVNGVVYNSDYSQVSGATVTIVCSGESLGGNLTDSHGAYARVFNETQMCGLGSSMSGEARFGEKVAVQSSFQIVCGDNSGCSGSSCPINSECKDDSIVVLLNFIFGAPAQPPAVVVGGGGGGGGGSGSRVAVQNNTNSTNVVNTITNEANNITEVSDDTEAENPGFLARITGAVVGAFGNAGTGVIFVVLILLAGSFIALRVVRARKAKVVKIE